MQLVLSNNRIIAHGENFLAMGGVVINTETGAKYENATIAECNGCPSDIDKVGYEYHTGVFVPCAPFAGNGNNNGYFMEVCEDCATPRNSGIPIKKGIGLANLASDVTAHALNGAEFTKLWENASPSSTFVSQSVSIPTLQNYSFAVICFYLVNSNSPATIGGAYSAIFRTDAMLSSLGGVDAHSGGAVAYSQPINDSYQSGGNIFMRGVHMMSKKIFFGGGRYLDSSGNLGTSNAYMVPYRIYGVKI